MFGKEFPGKILSIALLAVGVWGAPAQASIKDVESAIIQKDYGQAKQAAVQLLEQGGAQGQDQELRYYVGLCDLQLGEYAQAKKIFSELIREKKNIPLRDKAYLGLFDVYYIDGQYKKALKTVSRLLQLSPESEFLSLIYLKHARANLKLANWYKAREYLVKIIAECPHSLEVHVAKQLLNEEQYFAVQVGAFLDQKRAERLALELQDSGEYAYIVEATDRENRKFYRVRVGQLVRLDKAQKLETELSQQGYPTLIYP